MVWSYIVTVNGHGRRNGKERGWKSFNLYSRFQTQAELMRRAYQRHRPTEGTTSCSEKKSRIYLLWFSDKFDEIFSDSPPLNRSTEDPIVMQSVSILCTVNRTVPSYLKCFF